MKFLVRSFIVLLFAGLAAGVYWVSARGWGVPPMRDAALIEEMKAECPESQRRPDGSCPPRTYRSYFYAPLFFGRGPRGGK